MPKVLDIYCGLNLSQGHFSIAVKKVLSVVIKYFIRRKKDDLSVVAIPLCNDTHITNVCYKAIKVDVLWCRQHHMYNQSSPQFRYDFVELRNLDSGLLFSLLLIAPLLPAPLNQRKRCDVINEVTCHCSQSQGQILRGQRKHLNQFEQWWFNISHCIKQKKPSCSSQPLNLVTTSQVSHNLSS